MDGSRAQEPCLGAKTALDPGRTGSIRDPFVVRIGRSRAAPMPVELVP